MFSREGGQVVVKCRKNSSKLYTGVRLKRRQSQKQPPLNHINFFTLLIIIYQRIFHMISPHTAKSCEVAANALFFKAQPFQQMD